MKHRVTVRVPVEKRGLFGRKKTVYEERTVVVDSKWQVVYMKEKIFQGLRIQMRNICELFPIGDENITNAQ